jgi:hypothetical protein
MFFMMLFSVISTVTRWGSMGVSRKMILRRSSRSGWRNCLAERFIATRSPSPHAPSFHILFCLHAVLKTIRRGVDETGSSAREMKWTAG